MAKVEVKNLKNEKTKDLTLNAKVFGIEVNEVVLKKAIDLQLAATRQGTAKTKTVAEVSGGGRKPWRQKGTGRARQGSIRATQWRGGGIAGGVVPRDYTFKMNKKELIKTLGLDGKVLFVTADEAANLYLATRNLGYVYTLMSDEINCYDLVNADYVVVEEAAVKMIEEALK